MRPYDTNLNAFAKMLYDYMWAQRPPLSVNRFAQLVGISRQTLANWISGESFPQTKTLAHLSQQTGMPLEDLIAAVMDAIANSKPTPSVWTDLIARVERASEYDTKTRQEIIRQIRELREGYVANGDDGPATDMTSDEACRAPSS